MGIRTFNSWKRRKFSDSSTPCKFDKNEAVFSMISQSFSEKKQESDHRLQLLIEKGWVCLPSGLFMHYSFNTFDETASFLNAVFHIATKYNHHPEIWSLYSKISIRLYTFDLRSVSELDISMAVDIQSTIESIISQRSSK
jgi:4a-hydroxytetrahydrobiopterin dehydratase